MSKAFVSKALRFFSRRRFVALCALASASAALVLNPGQGFAQSAAPPGTPSALATRIHRDVAEVLQSSQAQDFMRRTSLVAGGQSPEEAAKFFASEAKLWGELIREAKLEPQ